MLSVEFVRQQASLLRKNAKFLETLIKASSVELYGEFYSSNHTHVVDYWTLVGVNKDLDEVIPFPVLAQLLGFKGQEVMDLLLTKPVWMAWKEERSCALGTHMCANEYFVHGSNCRHEEDFDQDRFSDTLEECFKAAYCQSCESHWPDELEAPKVRFDYMWGLAQTFKVDPNWETRY